MIEGLQYRQAGGVRLCLRDSGVGPTVLFLHGTTATLGVWDSVIEMVGDGVRSVAIDQRGHGRSDTPAAGYDAAEYCADARSLVTSLAGAPVVVVGHSLGARNAVVLGAMCPEAVAGVIAVDYTPFVEDSVLDALDRRVRGGDRAFDSQAEITSYLRQRYPLMPPDAVARRVKYGYHRVGEAFRALADPGAMTCTVEGLRRDFADDVRRISIPVTFMRGAMSEIVSAEAFAATRELRPDLRAVELAGVDHYVPEEAPGAVAAEIVRMLHKIAEAGARDGL